MPCHAMHPMQDYFWKVFHKYYNLICIFICTPICTKKIILAKSGCYRYAPDHPTDSASKSSMYE
jgi:hypothetical protein